MTWDGASPTFVPDIPCAKCEELEEKLVEAKDENRRLKARLAEIERSSYYYQQLANRPGL